MTPRSRHSGGSSSGSSHTTRPDTTAPDTNTRPLGGGRGDGTTVNVNDLDTMTTRLNATGGKVDAVGTTVGNINVGPQSMGIVGGNFTGAAQSHLKTAQQHVQKTRQAVDNAKTGTTNTATTYREREQTNKVNLEKSYGDTTTVPNTANKPTAPNTANRPTDPRIAYRNPSPPAGTTTPAAATTTPAAAASSSNRVNQPPPGADPRLALQQQPNPPASIGERLNPPPETNPAPSGWQPSQREQELQNRRINSLSNLGPGGNANEAFKAELDDGTNAVYKPVSGEDASLRQDITGDLGRREVAASRVDQMLGFDRVPTTTMVDGPHGPGSLQRFSEGSSDGLDANQYPRQQQQQMAVLDYITGNTDRHQGNYLTGPDGSVVAIDHGYSFPDGERDYIRSDFVRDHMYQPLDADVIDAVRNVDPNDMRNMLQQSGLSDSAIDLTIGRLTEIQRNGMITGIGWRGAILDANWGNVRGPLP
jgi:hypothetical protein